METIFARSGLLTLPFWLLMIAVPRLPLTRRLMGSPWPPCLAAVLYAALVLPRLVLILPAVSRPTLPGVAALLGSPVGATIAWAHFLAFDLFVGRWIYLDSRERSLPPLLMAPILVLTLLLGPLGLLLYLTVRAASVYDGPPKVWLRRAWALNPPLTVLGLVNIGLFAFALAGIAADHRFITGAPAWLKPAKFGLSVSIFAFTLVWLMTHIQGRERLTRALSWVAVVTLMIENGLIALQAARGTTSHFNLATPLDTAIYATMGVSIVVLWVATAGVALLLLRQRLPDPAFAWSLRLGLIVTLLGMLVGVLMTTRASLPQQAALAQHQRPTAFGGHAVGVRDDAPGLPGLDWKMRGGDLRVAHFVGLHALQVLPLVGWLLTLPRPRRWGERPRVALVWTAGLTYLAVVALLAWQALRGQSVFAPDGLMVAAFATVFTAAACAAGVILIGPLIGHRPRGAEAAEMVGSGAGPLPSLPGVDVRR